MVKEGRRPKPYSRGLVSGRKILEGTRNVYGVVVVGDWTSFCECPQVALRGFLFLPLSHPLFPSLSFCPYSFLTSLCARESETQKNKHYLNECFWIWPDRQVRLCLIV